MARRRHTDIAALDAILRELNLKGSPGSTQGDVKDVYQQLDTAELHPLIPTIGFEEIGAGPDQPRATKAAGRLIAVHD